jgi:hypothetical protein
LEWSLQSSIYDHLSYLMYTLIISIKGYYCPDAFSASIIIDA